MLGDLQNLEIKNISHFLKSDLYVVFGSSLIKGKLLKFLIKKKSDKYSHGSFAIL